MKKADASLVDYQSVFSHAHDAIFILEQDGAIVDANPAACTLTGYRRNEISVMHASDLFPIQLQIAIKDVIDQEIAISFSCLHIHWQSATI